MPTALARTANNKNAMTSSRPRCSMSARIGAGSVRADRADRMLAERPVGAGAPMLLLPDRRGLLERVDAVRAPRRRRRRGAATRPRPQPTAPTSVSSPTRCNNATRSRSGQRARAVRDDLGHHTLRGCFVRLVGHRGDAFASFGVIAHDADEAHDGAGARRRGPGVQRVDRQRQVGEHHPVERVGRCEHGASLRKEPRRSPGGRITRGRRVGAVAKARIRRYTRSPWVSGAKRVTATTTPTTRATIWPPTTTRTTALGARSPTRSTGSGCTRASSHRSRPRR